MNQPRFTIMILFTYLCLGPPASVLAVDAPATPATQPAASQPPAATSQPAVPVAILDFECNSPANPDLGKQISEVLMASLNDTPGIRLVDRAEMGKILQEHALSLSGLVDPAQQLNAGKLVGARILITGKVFAIDKETLITGKLIGTETSLLDSVSVKGAIQGDTLDLVMQLSQKIADRLPAAGPRLLPANEGITDPLPGLKTRLAGRKLPKVCVNITERHLTPVVAVHVDPAVETELKNVLISAGFKVFDAPTEGELDKAGVDVAITGQAFSEFNARIGNLMSCSGRAEIKATLRKNGQVFFSDRATTRAVDLADNVAGKTALQKAGHELAIKLLQHFDETLPPAAATQPAKGG